MRLPPFALVLGTGVLWSLRSSAQVLLPSAAIPLVGDTFRVFGVDNDTSVVPGASGLSLVWDYTALLIDTTAHTLQTCVDPATLPLIGAYPNCDHAMRWSLSTDPGYAAERYFTTSPEGLLELAEHGPLIDYVFDAPELSLAAPLAYGDTVDDAWCYTSAGLGVNYHFCGLTRHTLDATGTLVMPYGTIPDVLRTRTRTYHVSDDTPADTSYNITHAWWVPGLRWPLLEHNRFIDSNGNELISVTVLGASQALAVPDRSVVDALLYPVPFRDELTLRFLGALRHGGQVQVHALDGRSLFEALLPPSIGKHTLQLGALPAGALLVTIHTEEGRSAHPVLHQP
ncbi:MAG: hypothetical protein IPG10_16590 [Flavobacteriales bacterium]|nr:hypothetical protein [Flavobacteriales bacterium]